jgi:ribosome-binding factor A
MPGDGWRDARVADRVREELAHVLTREISDPRVEGIRVLRVVVSGDLQVAWVYLGLGHLDTPENRKRALRGIESAKGRIRSRLSSRVDLRRAPELRFAFDEAIDEQSKILALLDEVKEDS